MASAGGGPLTGLLSASALALTGNQAEAHQTFESDLTRAAPSRAVQTPSENLRRAPRNGAAGPAAAKIMPSNFASMPAAARRR
jgi:hypothetical protein